VRGEKVYGGQSHEDGDSQKQDPVAEYDDHAGARRDRHGLRHGGPGGECRVGAAHEPGDPLPADAGRGQPESMKKILTALPRVRASLALAVMEHPYGIEP
jgi:hypothetical protein